MKWAPLNSMWLAPKRALVFYACIGSEGVGVRRISFRHCVTESRQPRELVSWSPRSEGNRQKTSGHPPSSLRHRFVATQQSTYEMLRPGKYMPPVFLREAHVLLAVNHHPACFSLALDEGDSISGSSSASDSLNRANSRSKTRRDLSSLSTVHPPRCRHPQGAGCAK